MCKCWIQWKARAAKAAGQWGGWLAVAAAGIFWFDPSSGLAKAILWGVGLHGLWNGKKTVATWRSPAGILFGLALMWTLLSVVWSYYPAGTALDLLKSAPMVLTALALPAIFNRPGRIWAALVASAGLVTVRLAVDLFRIVYLLGWPQALSAARFLHPYLYTHPNVSSMMAGLSALVFAARWVAGVACPRRKLLLAAGIALDLFYMVVLASRGPQVIFALAALAFPILLVPGWRWRLAAVLAAVALGAGLFQVADRVNPRFRDGTMGNFNRRDTIWSHARMLADERPVLGYGFGKKTFFKAVYENPEQRAPLVPIRYPHAHSYWLMLYFQGGAVGFLLWGAGWLVLGVRLACFANRADRAASAWRERLATRVLPVLLGTGMTYILIYGIADYPDNVIRHAQFYLIGLALALTRPSPPDDISLS